MGDIAASVLAKLKNKAKETDKSFQLCLQLFCQEEFLRKLALSRFSDNLVLKGGLFIYALTNFESRATIDIDFLLRKIPIAGDRVKDIIEEILAVDTGNDYIHFEFIGTSPIALQQDYSGFSVKLLAIIKNTKTPINIDIGVGDSIVPSADNLSFSQVLSVMNTFLNPVFDSFVANADFKKRWHCSKQAWVSVE